MVEQPEHTVLSLAIVLAINLSVLYYVWYVTQDKCNCLVDWRNKYIKYYCIAVIALNLMVFFLNGSLDPTVRGLVVMTILIAGLIYLYALYTYTHQLDKDNCECATKDNEYLHTALYYYSYLFYVQAVLVALIAFLLLGRTVGLIDIKDKQRKSYPKTKKLKKSRK